MAWCPSLRCFCFICFLNKKWLHGVVNKIVVLESLFVFWYLLFCDTFITQFDFVFNEKMASWCR